MKKGISFLKAGLVVLLGILLFACDNGELKTGNIYVYASAYPNTDVLSGTTAYNLSVYIVDRVADDNGDFSGVNISMNGVDFSDTSSETNHFVDYNLATVGEGDSLTINISHPLIGDIELTETVPPALTSFNISPDLPDAPTSSSAESYTLSWSHVTGSMDTYIAYMYAYSDVDEVNYLIGRGVAHTSTATQFSTVDSSNTAYPYLKFTVSSSNESSFLGFADHSKFRVQSTFSETKKNTN